MNPEEMYYENLDLWAASRYGEAEQDRMAAIARKVPLKVRTLLDVGCGNGLFLHYLYDSSRTFDRLCGIDRSGAALSFVRCEKFQGNIDALPFSGCEFDLVVCTEVLEHLTQSAYLLALSELTRVAREYIVISVPFNENIQLSLTECDRCFCRFNPNYHLRSFTHDTMNSLLSHLGFKCIDIFYICYEKIVPYYVRAIYQIIVQLRKTLLSPYITQPSLMAPYSICPACGYSRAIAKQTSDLSTVPESRLRSCVRAWLKMQATWRWIGGLYQRVAML